MGTRPVLGPIQLPPMGTGALPGGKEARVSHQPPTPSSAEVRTEQLTCTSSLYPHGMLQGELYIYILLTIFAGNCELFIVDTVSRLFEKAEKRFSTRNGRFY